MPKPTSVDSLDMYEATASFPEQVERAISSARGHDGLPDRERIEHVVVLGMGSSGTAGDILQAVASPILPVPVTVVRGYELPSFVGEGSLVFAPSFSGNTEETIEAATEAAVHGATVVAITSGGELAKLASGWGAPAIDVPDSIPQARSALGALLMPMFVVLEEVGLFAGAQQWMEFAVEQLKKRRDELIQPGGLAEQIATQLADSLVLIHGGGPVGASAALRWKTQFNENAKQPAFWACQPELCHHELAGWGRLADFSKRHLAQITLRHDAEHPQVLARFDLVAELYKDKVASQIEVRAEGEGDLAQILDLALIGDFVTLQLAYNANIDPGPVPEAGWIKEQLAAR